MYKYPDYLMHHGVKGMRWGVRKKKDKAGSKKYTASPRISMSLKTKHGEVLTASQYKQSKMTSFLARHNLKIQKQVENTKNFELKNEKGDTVGNLQLFHESPISVNVVWIGVNKKYEGKNYGQTAMKMAENYARKSGAKQMTLEVPGTSPNARHIYEKQGFVSQGQISDPDDVWGGLTAMKKKF